ncbi:GNAT family N-acetyltransferase [Paenibacillus rhizophilus]|uniref:GNAT family N-acetyltransferase n=1 Tax=Paenibacillus rhizophilus TaxID=1850366 RepID=A0A3N9NXL0_9BACL|nr:GNAT family N-acetyltransferase [Paenibacillus rhizophilus]RQW08405.1 GNAT family N-acetyltransferase [Paenibacillus rhizophilus]
MASGYPGAWSSLIDDKITKFTRVNFRFDRIRYENAVKDRGGLRHAITPTTQEIFLKLEGRVAPKYFWSNAEQFAERGIGYTLTDGGEAASTAFSAFVEDNQLEIGIETNEQHRGKGYASHVCSALIDYCLENGLEPVWSCRKENEGSYYLAQKLGFVPTVSIPYLSIGRVTMKLTGLPVRRARPERSF